MKIKYSKQRELVLSTVKENKVHPTAEYVYNFLKRDNPELSLGTVYRNLQHLVSVGKIIRISFQDKPDRFDGNTCHHYHAICEECGEFKDIFLDYNRSIDNEVEILTGHKVCSHNTIFNIICSDCILQKKESFYGIER